MGKVRDAELRRLSADLGVEAPLANAMGLWLGLGLCVLLGALLFAITAPRGPAGAVYGKVVGFGFAETDYGSLAFARIAVDNREARVRLPTGALCRAGDRIALKRRKALLGYRYVAAPPGCTRT